MAPLVEAFPPWQLEARVQKDSNGKMRKAKDKVDLKDCKLMEMVQYVCNLKGPAEDPATVVVCEPVVRLFRRCAKNLTVETTLWEDL